jgi:hypothetical protein
MLLQLPYVRLRVIYEPHFWYFTLVVCPDSSQNTNHSMIQGGIKQIQVRYNWEIDILHREIRSYKRYSNPYSRDEPKQYHRERFILLQDVTWC